MVLIPLKEQGFLMVAFTDFNRVGALIPFTGG
jgi:hypothetical protein